MSFRFTVSLFEADRDAGSPDAEDITSILRKSEHGPVSFPVLDDGDDRVHHLLELRIGDRPEPMSVEVDIPRWHVAFPVPDRFVARTFFQWFHLILPFVGLVAGLALSNPTRRRDTPNHKEA